MFKKKAFQKTAQVHFYYIVSAHHFPKNITAFTNSSSQNKIAKLVLPKQCVVD